MVRAVQRAMHYVSSPRRSRAAVLVPSRVRHSSAILPLALRLKPQAHKLKGERRTGERSLADAVGRSRRPAPDAVAAHFFRPLLMARGRPARECGSAPSAKQTGTPHRAYAIGRTRRRPDAVAAPTPSRRGLC